MYVTIFRQIDMSHILLFMTFLIDVFNQDNLFYNTKKNNNFTVYVLFILRIIGQSEKTNSSLKSS